MGETLSKLRPDRDLQCYFLRPSAIAALSETTASGFTVSGSWRQQFDWALVEWNRDNVFEHPALRNLPDSDLSGVHLSYEETRTNCISQDSSWYRCTDWPYHYLRIWAGPRGSEKIYYVPLLDHATPAGGSYQPAVARFTLSGTITRGDYVELAWLDQHFNAQGMSGDSAEDMINRLAYAINHPPPSVGDPGVTASVDGKSILLTYTGAPGSNGNRIGVYGTVHGAGTESWDPPASLFSDGMSPDCWKVDLDFGSLRDVNNDPIPTSQIRKMRWTWGADVQSGAFLRSTFSVVVSNWRVSGTDLGYTVPGPGSRRIEDDSSEILYSGAWNDERGNFSGGSVRWTNVPGSEARFAYTASSTHSLFLGSRSLAAGGKIAAEVDGKTLSPIDLQMAGEDVLQRISLGTLESGIHSVLLKCSDTGYFYFDFLEIVVPTTELPSLEDTPRSTLATDWDTDHSLAIAPERTAWLIHELGFHGRANHYAGALWHYELCQPGMTYAKTNVTFQGAPAWGDTSTYTQITLGPTAIKHWNLIGDTAESLAKCFELLINAGSTGVWAQANASSLTISARAPGSEGNTITISVSTTGVGLYIGASGPALSGGCDGSPEGPEGTVWRTDLSVSPKLNRAAQDWHRSFFRALKSYGINPTAAFSMELQHGDDSPASGIAQRFPDGTPAWLNTPALQTNFGPASTSFWKEVYRDMATVMAEAGVDVRLQFGEVQWWYFAKVWNSVIENWQVTSGMPFYDEYTKNTFYTSYGRAMRTISCPDAQPTDYPEECAFLPTLIGQFTETIMGFVRQSYPNAQFEVLYPPDVNDTPLNRLINFPNQAWTPATLAWLKTENFTYTGNRNLDKIQESIQFPFTTGFPRSQSSHLVGIGEYTTPWPKEFRSSLGEEIDSVVLFALDQFCLIGYELPLDSGSRRSLYMGG
jgi:hypothetical protein